MNYFLIANNTSITNKTIENLPIEEEDLVILYNKQMPLKWEKIKKHKNKWLFLRKNKNGYSFEKTLSNNKNKYKNIILTGFLVEVDELEKYKNKYKLTNLSGYSYKNDVEKLNIFGKDKIPQSGLISYIYIINKLKFDKIYLVGFTNTYKSVLWCKHSKVIEQNFYKNEIKNGFLIKIDE